MLLLCSFNVFDQEYGLKKKISSKICSDINQGPLGNKDNFSWIYATSGGPNVQSIYFYVAECKNILPMNEECKPQKPRKYSGMKDGSEDLGYIKGGTTSRNREQMTSLFGTDVVISEIWSALETSTLRRLKNCRGFWKRTGGIIERLANT